MIVFLCNILQFLKHSALFCKCINKYRLYIAVYYYDFLVLTLLSDKHKLDVGPYYFLDNNSNHLVIT